MAVLSENNQLGLDGHDETHQELARGHNLGGVHRAMAAPHSGHETPAGAQIKVDALAPWTVDVHPAGGTPLTHTLWSGAIVTSGQIGLAVLTSASTGAAGASVTLPVSLAAGTWTVEIIYIKNPDGGIITLDFDTTVVGTFDTYASAQALNQRATFTGVVFSTNGKKQMRFRVLSKNASATEYIGRISHIQLRRTA